MDILQMSVSAVVFIVAVIMLRALTLYKLPKRTFIILWGVVLIRLLIPFSIPSRLSIYTGIEKLSQALTATTVQADSSGIAVSNHAASTIPAVNSYRVADSVTTAAWLNISPLMLIWLIGACAVGLFFAITYIKCCREFRTTLPVECNFISTWQQQHPLRRNVQIRQSDRIKAPLTYGVFHPVVLLPKTMDWTDETKLRYVLSHEYVHIKRFDVLLKFVLTIVVCVHWFNPFVWVMYILANQDIELSCDEAVVRIFGDALKSDYAMTLIGLEEKKSRWTPLCNNFSKNAIEERITAIMKIRKISTPVIVVAVLLIASVTVACATSKSTATDNASAQNTTEVLVSTSPSPNSIPTSDTAAAEVDTETPLVSSNTKTAIEETPDLKKISNLNWIWPCECKVVTEPFGERYHPVTKKYIFSDHISIGANNGEAVYAALDGTISDASYDSEKGNYIVIDHGNGVETIYQHLSALLVSAGDTVTAGANIGEVGATGNVTGPCLFFSVYLDGQAVDPSEYLK